MSTGDLKNNVKKLQSQIKVVKYTGKLDLDGIKDGSPTALLPLYHYIFTSYSNKLNRDISNSNNELYGKSDLRFIEAIYKILRDMFSYKPPITREQFFLPGFAERKVIMATDILRHIHSAYTPPSSSSSYKLASRMEKKQHDIQTKVQDSSQNDFKLPTKPRKVASKTGPDMTEAIVLPRYISSSQDWRENRAAAWNTPTPSDISDTDIVHQVHPKPSSSNSNVSVEDTNDMTKQFTEHITNTLTLLNNQVGKISTALQKVEDKVAVNQTPRIEETVQRPLRSDNLQMETLLSKVILLENRMTLLENKVQDSSQNDFKLPTKPRKVASKTGPDMTEAIVLPRYISSSQDWRENRAAAWNTPTPSDISDTDIVHQVHPKPSSSNSNVSVEDTNDMTKQFTEHITNTLTLLNNQVGKISTALQKVEDKVAVNQTPRIEETVQRPLRSDNLQMETLLSKVILLENRMTLLENKVDDIQSFCTIMLENRNYNSNTETGRQDIISVPPNGGQIEEKEKGGTNEMHPSYVDAFAPVPDMGVSSFGGRKRGQDRGGQDTIDNNDDDNDVTIEDVIARDSGVEGRIQPCKPEDMKFMKTLVGPNDSNASLREQDDSSTLLPELHNKNHPNSGIIHQAWTTQDTKAQEDSSFGNIFSPIRGHTDASLVPFDDNSMIHIPFGGIEEDYESKRLSSTPNKADLDSSTLSRVDRIMQMMKATQKQFQN